MKNLSNLSPENVILLFGETPVNYIRRESLYVCEKLKECTFTLSEVVVFYWLKHIIKFSFRHTFLSYNETELHNSFHNGEALEAAQPYRSMSSFFSHLTIVTNWNFLLGLYSISIIYSVFSLQFFFIKKNQWNIFSLLRLMERNNFIVLWARKDIRQKIGPK